MTSGTKTRKTLTIGKRLLLVVLIMAGIMIAMLKLAENSRDSLRLGLEDYLVKTTGHPSEITTLEKSDLFPDMDFIMRGIVVRDSTDRNKTLLTIDTVKVAMPFWKRFVGIVDFKELSFEKVAIATGYLLPKKIDIGFAGISDALDPAAPPYFLIDGRYNDRDVLMTAEMRRHGRSDVHYNFSDEFPVTFKIGGTEAMGTMSRGFSKSRFKDVELVSGGQKAILTIADIGHDPFKMSFAAEMEKATFEGELSRLDGVLLLNIRNLQGDMKDVERFLASVRQDLALEDDKIFKVTMDYGGSETAPNAEEKVE